MLQPFEHPVASIDTGSVPDSARFKQHGRPTHGLLIFIGLLCGMALLRWSTFRSIAVCRDCGQLRSTVDYQLPLLPITYWRHSGTKHSPLSTTAAQLGLTSAHAHRWTLIHGGGNGILCALGTGGELHATADSRRVAAFIADTNDHRGRNEALEWIHRALDDSNHQAVLNWVVQSDFPEQGVDTSLGYEAWRESADPKWPEWLAFAHQRAKQNEPARTPLTHVNVYAPPGRFGGWPANHGIWSWGDEILVGFSAGYFKDNGPGRHAIDHDRPEEHLLARSLDGGQTWTIENPAEQGALIPAGGALHGVAPPGLKERPWLDCPGGINFRHPDFAITVRMTDVAAGPSRFSYSNDRGKTWHGPFRLPLFDQTGIAGRTDYLPLDRHSCLLFLTAAKSNGREGRPLCVRTTDGGKTWRFVSWIGEEPRGYAIMPSTIRIGEAELLSAIRCREGATSWIDTYRSPDLGQSWQLDQARVAETGEGSPPSLIRLKDGRLCLTYGYRAAPYGIRARLSSDRGRSWGQEIILRADGGGRDVGYPRSVQRADGRIVTVYYFHDQPLGDRYIAATIWNPEEG
jgi:hypothetical protein